MKILLTLLLSISAYATKPSDICRRQLSVGQKYKLATYVLGQSRDRGAFNITVTMLLGETFAPVLQSLSSDLRAMTLAELRPKLEEAGRRITSIHYTSQDGESPGGDFDSEYVHAYRIGLKVGFTDYNRAGIWRLGLAVSSAQEIFRTRTNSNDHIEAQSASALLWQHSFTANNLEQALYFGNASVLHGVALLTAVPFENFGADELVREVLRESSGRASLVLQLSLMLPPGVLGEMAPHFYHSATLARNSNGEIDFAPEFREIIKSYRDRFCAAMAKSYEHGNGCPVAHRQERNKVSPLEEYLQSLLHVYELAPAQP